MENINLYLNKFDPDLAKTEDQLTYFNNAKADAIHCYQSIEKYLYKDKKILEVGGAFICLPAFYTKIMILLPLSLVVLPA
jgi:hypothetical protein